MDLGDRVSKRFRNKSDAELIKECEDSGWASPPADVEAKKNALAIRIDRYIRRIVKKPTYQWIWQYLGLSLEVGQEETIQDLQLKTFTSLQTGKYVEKGIFVHWVNNIAANHMKSLLREGNPRSVERLENGKIERGPMVVQHFSFSVDIDDLSPDQRAIYFLVQRSIKDLDPTSASVLKLFDETEIRSKWQILAPLLSELRDDYKQVLLLYSQGYSFRQIAEMLGKPIGSVKGWWKRAIEQIRARLEDLGLLDE